MNPLHNSRLSGHAKRLRKDMTKEERHLWYDFLKGLPVMVHRQKVIGNYIVDFYIAECKIVIELDGTQHYEADGMDSDRTRDEALRSVGITVLRYSNTDINRRFTAVCEDIWNRLQASEKKPSPRGEGGKNL